MFHYDQSRRDGLELFCLNGPLVAETLPQLAPAVDGLGDGALRKVQFDMSQVPQIDSRGIGALVGWHGHFVTRGVEFQLVGVGESLLRVFRICNLTSLLNLGPEPASEEESLLRRRQALMDSFEYGQKVLSALGQGIIGLDPDDHILFVDTGAEDLLGVREPELQGRPLGEEFVFVPLSSMYSPPRERDFAAGATEYGGLLKQECRIGAGGREPIPVSMTVTAIASRGERAGAVVGLQDIRPRIRVEEALLESERRYRLLSEHVSDVIWTTDLEFRLTFISPSIERLQGYPPSELYQRMPTDSLTPESSAIATKVLQREMQAEARGGADPGRSVLLELQMTRKGGDPIWVEMSVTFLRDPAGRAVGLLGVTRDIDQRKRAETQREELQGQLLQVQKMEAIGTLAAGVAHDFNNLLTAILGHASLIRARSQADAETLESLTVIEEAADRGAKLTSGLLGFARRSSAIAVPIDVGLCVREFTGMLSEMFDRRIEIVHNPGPAGLRVVADRSQLQHALLNLALNARDAMPDGGRITIGLERAEIGGGHTPPPPGAGAGPYAVISVADTGEGISPADQKRIFEPFFTTREPGSGTGMGLALVYGIANNHGGWIEVSSAPGQGSTFRLYLPLAPELKAGEPAASRPVDGPARILVVDDEEPVRNLARKMLERLGHAVTLARDGQEAVERFSQTPDAFDLVILDVVMPRMDGPACLRELRKLRPQLRVVLSSGYSREGALQEILEHGASGFVQKPYRLQELASVVTQALA